MLKVVPARTLDAEPSALSSPSAVSLRAPPIAELPQVPQVPQVRPPTHASHRRGVCSRASHASHRRAHAHSPTSPTTAPARAPSLARAPVECPIHPPARDARPVAVQSASAQARRAISPRHARQTHTLARPQSSSWLAVMPETSGSTTNLASRRTRDVALARTLPGAGGL